MTYKWKKMVSGPSLLNDSPDRQNVTAAKSKMARSTSRSIAKILSEADNAIEKAHWLT